MLLHSIYLQLMLILIKSGVKKMIAWNKCCPFNIHKMHVLSTAREAELTQSCGGTIN